VEEEKEEGEGEKGVPPLVPQVKVQCAIPHFVNMSVRYVS